MAKGDQLKPAHHVARYCRPSTVGEDGLPATSAFELKQSEDHLSVNWMEFFDIRSKKHAVGSIRQAFVNKGYELRKTGRFAVLSVGKSKDRVKHGVAKDLQFLHWPEDNDKSHSGIFGYSSEDLQVALELKSLVTAVDVFPAVS